MRSRRLRRRRAQRSSGCPDVNALLAEEETIARIDKVGGMIVAGWSPRQTTKMIADEFAHWADVANKAGLSAQ